MSEREPRQVWACEYGAYSDHYTGEMFTTLELAREFVRSRGFDPDEDFDSLYESSRPSISTYQLYDFVPGSVPFLRLTAVVGPGAKVYNERRDTYDIVEGSRRAVQGRSVPWNAPRGPDIYVEVEGTDQRGVEKAYSERLSQAQEELKDAPASGLLGKERTE